MIPTIPVKLLENNFNDNLITFSIIQNGNIYYIPQSWAVYVQTLDGIWTSESAVINSIRNMFDYDLCNQIGPKMKKETSVRLRWTWMDLFRLRKQIHADRLEPFLREAEDKKLETSVQWICYEQLSPCKKQLLCLRGFVKNWKAIVKAPLRKIRSIAGKLRN